MEIWDLYFAQLAAWRLHPGYQREGAKVPSFSEIAEMADEMLKEREKWLLRQQQ